MKKKLLFWICLLTVTIVQGQKVKKPTVLVYGTGIAAFSAAMQSAKSDVPTLWVIDGNGTADDLLEGVRSIKNTFSTDGGIWMDLLMRMALSDVKSDSLARLVKNDLQPELLKKSVFNMIAEQKNLTVMYDVRIKSLKKQKKYWTLVLSNKKRINVRAIVDLSKEQNLSKLVFGYEKVVVDSGLKQFADLTDKETRTLISSGELNGELKVVQLSDLLKGEKNGFISMYGVGELLNSGVAELPFLAAMGQAIGATAAYLAFFKTTTDKIDVRKLQTELLLSGMRIIPYQDMSIEDPNFIALQKGGLAAVLNTVSSRFSYNVPRDEYVSYEETRLIFEEIYTRAQLWYVNRDGEYFTWNTFLDLVQFVGLKGDEVRQQVARDWVSKLYFEGEFDGQERVTRYQFFTVLDRYASPYAISLSQSGVFQN